VDSWCPCVTPSHNPPVPGQVQSCPAACPNSAHQLVLVLTPSVDPLSLLLQVMKLAGHRDFSFAAAWHPGGQLLATGNQDSTTRVWDVRKSSTPLAVLAGTMGAIRTLRFSCDGAFLAAAEPADFVHVYDVASGFAEVQQIDLFGEVAGISFSPDGAHSLFVAISDTLYSSLLHYHRMTDFMHL